MSVVLVLAWIFKSRVGSAGRSIVAPSFKVLNEATGWSVSALIKVKLCTAAVLLQASRARPSGCSTWKRADLLLLVFEGCLIGVTPLRLVIASGGSCTRAAGPCRRGRWPRRDPRDRARQAGLMAALGFPRGTAGRRCAAR